MINILYFAHLRELLKTEQEQITLPDSIQNMAGLRQHLINRGQPWAAALANDKLVMMSVNQSIATEASSIKDGDEVAFFPPVTGG